MTEALHALIAQALRDAACTGDCGLDEDECFDQHGIHEFSRVHGVTESVYADIEALAAVIVAVVVCGEKHAYLSTGCLHGNHDYCKNTEGRAGTKRPAECKFCQAPCLCSCHREDS